MRIDVNLAVLEYDNLHFLSNELKELFDSPSLGERSGSLRNVTNLHRK